jgi:hypothetical protein
MAAGKPHVIGRTLVAEGHRHRVVDRESFVGECDVELRQYPNAWRATFYPTGIAHSVVLGSAWEPSASRAVQRAAWRALAAGEGRGPASAH